MDYSVQFSDCVLKPHAVSYSCSRTNVLLEEFCEAADPPFFYTGLWECILNCPSVRLPAVTFLVNHFNKRRTMEDQLHMMGLDIDLMVRYGHVIGSIPSLA